MSEAASEAITGHDEAHVHVVPPRILLGVFGALAVLTVVTVAVTYVDLGEMNLIVALAIAVVKATLVALYFMHLRWDRPINAVVFVTAIVFVTIFVAIALLDTQEYQPDLIPGHAPALER